MHLNYKLLESKAVSFTSLAISIESGNVIRNWCSVNVYWSGPCLPLQFYVWLIFSHFLPSQYTLYLDKDSAYLLCIARVPRTPLYHGTCITLLSLFSCPSSLLEYKCQESAPPTPSTGLSHTRQWRSVVNIWMKELDLLIFKFSFNSKPIWFEVPKTVT